MCGEDISVACSWRIESKERDEAAPRGKQDQDVMIEVGVCVCACVCVSVCVCVCVG